MPAPIASLAATFITTLFAVSLLPASSAFSWFDKGRRVVGLIAWENLTSAARDEIEKILSPGTTLAGAAVWPDREARSIRDFDPLHYVRIPDGAVGYDRQRDCPGWPGC